MIDCVLSPAPSLLARAKVALVRGQVVDGARGEAAFFVGGELELEGFDDHTSEAFLDREDIVDDAVVGVGPQVMVGARIDELSCDAQPASGSADAAFEDIPHAQLGGDRLHVLGRASECHRRGA